MKRVCNKDKVQGDLRMPQAHKLGLLMCFLSLTTYMAPGRVVLKGIAKVRLSQRIPQYTHTDTYTHIRTSPPFPSPYLWPCPLWHLPDSLFLHTQAESGAHHFFSLCTTVISYHSSQYRGQELLICSFSSRPSFPKQQREAVGRETEPRPRSGVLPVFFRLL